MNLGPWFRRFHKIIGNVFSNWIFVSIAITNLCRHSYHVPNKCPNTLHHNHNHNHCPCHSSHAPNKRPNSCHSSQCPNICHSTSTRGPVNSAPIRVRQAACRPSPSRSTRRRRVEAPTADAPRAPPAPTTERSMTWRQQKRAIWNESLFCACWMLSPCFECWFECYGFTLLVSSWSTSLFSEFCLVFCFILFYDVETFFCFFFKLSVLCILSKHYWFERFYSAPFLGSFFKIKLIIIWRKSFFVNSILKNALLILF